MNRLERLSAILIQLQSRRKLTARQLSEKFLISPRTVYRDVHALQEAGVPVIGEAGSGYTLMEGYSIPPVMFNSEEASALMLAGKLMQLKADGITSKRYDSALDKIRALLRFAEKEQVEDIEDHIFVLNHPTIPGESPKDLHLQTILRAIGEKRLLEMTYLSLEENTITHRKIEPVGIYYLGNHWHLVAFCLLRQDYRNFRTDRIKKLSFLEQKVTRLHPALKEFVKRMTEKKELHEVKIEINSQTQKYLGDQKYYAGFVKEEFSNNKFILTFLTSSLPGFARWMMVFGDRAKIIEPASLKGLVRGLAGDIIKNLDLEKTC